MSRTHFRAVSLLVWTAAGAAAQAPSILALNPTSITAGTAFTLTISGSNFVSGAVISWNNTILTADFQPVFGQLSASIPSSLTAIPGFVAIQVINPGNTQSNTLAFAVTAQALTISTSTLPATMTMGTTYSISLSAGGGTPPYTWAAASSLPPGLLLSSAGLLRGMPAAGGSFSIGVKVSDSQGATTTRSLSLAVTGVAITTAATLPPATATLPYSQTLSAAGGSAPYTWSNTSTLPPGLSLNAATGVISGAPSVAGSFTFSIQVSDSARQTGTQTFTLTINPAPLTITTITPLFDGIVGTLYSQTFSASGGNRPYQWSIVSGGAGDLNLDTASGALQGTPQSAGTLSFTIQVADASGTRVTGSFSIIVRPPSLTIVTAVALPQGAVGVDYNQQFSVVGGTPPYTWSLTTGSIPGLTFDASRAGLRGTPSTPGTFNFTLQARDSAGVTTSRTFVIAISPAALTIVTDLQLPDGTLGAPYSFQMTAAGGIPPYVWSGSGLPAGLSIDPNTGIISGTLSIADPPPFAVRVVDSARLSATNQFRINAALPRVPQVTLSGLADLVEPAQQLAVQISIDSSFPTAISGQAIVSFSPEVGGRDETIQFSTGGVTAPFTIPAGATTASTVLALQTGTVAGQLSVSLRLQAGGHDVTPSPAPVLSAHIDQAAPVVQSATVTRTTNGFSIQIAGYSTSREITQAIFTFGTTSGQTLQNSQITVPVDTIFGKWYQDPAATAYGSQFVFAQPFTIQGDASAVTPQSVTLVNRKGTVTAQLGQ